jgi:glyoxylase-like metal-dependent hydrolase (beta-lactamase superfamily II)
MATVPAMSTETQQWQVGAATITSVVEDEVAQIPPEFFFPDADAAQVAAHPWCVPTYADAAGNVSLRVQALVVETAGRRVLVDPCVGNFKDLGSPFWSHQEWPFMDRFAAAGFTVDGIDTVVHTHTHPDHIGWDTHLVDGAWVPTFTRARHLYTVEEMAFARLAADHEMMRHSFRDSIEPIVDAGLADEVAMDADLGDGLRFEPTPGHTPGQVALWIESEGERALISGDFIHHPVQCSEPDWAEIGDLDADEARATRHRMLHDAATGGYLVVGTHFPGRPAGRVVAVGDAWRFEPV